MQKLYPLSKLIYPLFLSEVAISAAHAREPEKFPSLLPSSHLSTSELVNEISHLNKLGLASFLIYPLSHKDQSLSEAEQMARVLDTDYFLFKALSTCTSSHPNSLFIVDLCTCHFLSSGQCGSGNSSQIDETVTLGFFRRMAPLLAATGIHAICLSSMMDGVVTSVREALDNAGYCNTLLISQSAKIHSGFYGPFQSLSGGLRSLDLKKSYQLSPANKDEMIRELALDCSEGADMAVLKPISLSLDIVTEVRRRFSLPLLAYTTGGEFLMFQESLPKQPRARLLALNQYFTNFSEIGISAVISYLALEYAQLSTQITIK